MRSISTAEVHVAFKLALLTADHCSIARIHRIDLSDYLSYILSATTLKSVTYSIRRTYM